MLQALRGLLKRHGSGLRTFVALLAFFAIVVVVWWATVLAWVGIVWLTGFDDRDDVIGLIVILYLAPLTGFAVAVAGAMMIVEPRSPSAG